MTREELCENIWRQFLSASKRMAASEIDCVIGRSSSSSSTFIQRRRNCRQNIQHLPKKTNHPTKGRCPSNQGSNDNCSHGDWMIVIVGGLRSLLLLDVGRWAGGRSWRWAIAIGKVFLCLLCALLVCSCVAVD